MNSNASAARKHRIFLVDDHPLVREGLTNLINGQNDLSFAAKLKIPPEP